MLPVADDKLHAEALEAYEEAIEAASENRNSYLESHRFWRLADQWPENIKKARTTPGKERLMLTVNKGPAFAKQVINDIRQNRPSIKVRPVDSAADIQTALVNQGLIKNIEQSSNAAVAYDTGAECSVYGGFGYFAIDYDYATPDSFEMDIMFRRIANALSVVGDPYSQAVDSSDWNRAFECELLSEDQFKRDYPDADPISFSGMDQSVLRHWQSGKDVLVAAYWKREETDRKILLMSDRTVIEADQYTGLAKAAFDATGVKVVRERIIKAHKVKKCVLNGQEILTKRKVKKDGAETEVDHYDWPGQYIPIIPIYGEEINIEGKRIFRSMLHDAMDPQRQLNYWETTATELVALAPRVPFLLEEGAEKVDQNWATANTENHAYLLYKKGSQAPVRLQVDSGPAIGAMTQAKQASDNMKAVLGMYDASIGNRSNETSGIAIERRQREGDTGQFHFSDNLMRAVRWGGIVVMDLIPHVYTADRIVRVLGDDGQAQNVKLGPRQYPEQPEAQPGQQPEPPKIGALQGVFDIGMGKYDITVEAGPSYTTQRQETADIITKLASADPRVMEIGGDILVGNLDFKDGDELARRLKKMLPPQLQDGGEDQIPPQVQAMIEQGKQIIAELQDENEKLKTQVGSARAAEAKVATEQSKIDLERSRIPIDKLEKEIDLLTAQKELLTAQANLEKVRGEIVTAKQEIEGQIATGQNEQVNAVAPQLMQALQVISDQVSRPRVKRARAAKGPDGVYQLESIEEIAPVAAQ